MPRSHAGSSSIEMTNKELRKALLKYGLPPASKELLELFPFHAAQVYSHLQEFPSPVPPEADGCPKLKLCQMMVSVVNEFCYLTREHKRHESFIYREYLSLNYRYQQAIKSRSEAEENLSHCYAQITSLSGEVAEDNKQIQESDVQISDLKVLCTTLTSQLEALRLVMETKNERISTQEQYTNDLQAEIEYLQDENQLLESNIAVLQSENANLKRSFEEAFEVVSPTTPGTGTSSEEKESEEDISPPLQEDDTTPPPSPATQSRIELLNLNSESEEEQLDDNQSSTSSLPSLVSVKMELAPVPVKPDFDN